MPDHHGSNDGRGVMASARARRIVWTLLAVTTACATVIVGISTEPSQRLGAPWRSALTTEILVLGDSQLSFGAGPVLRDFFADLPAQCRAHVASSVDLALLADKRFAMIGTRSTSLQSWVTSKGRAWELLCDKDKTWGINASTWGTVKPPDKRYVQIGVGDHFQFCARDEGVPLDLLLSPGYYTPELIMMFVGGNGAGRLARNPSAAIHDVSQFIERLPPGTGCIFMMTAPIYSKVHNDTRAFAQANLKTAFAAHADRCAFVKGHTPDTRSAIEGQKHYFKRDEAGNVRDPYHANREAAARFLSWRRGDLCRALVSQLR
jgi:hypothetical protein